MGCSEGEDVYKRQALVGVQPCYLPDQNYEWHEHLHGVTESQWATTGALRQVCGSLDIPTVTPLAPGSVYADYADLTQYDAFLLVEGCLLYTSTGCAPP